MAGKPKSVVVTATSVVAAVVNFIVWWSELGIVDPHPTVRRRQSALNILALFAFTVIVPFIVIYALTAGPSAPLLVASLIPWMILFALIPQTHRFGFIAAAYFLCALWLFGVGMMVFFLGRQSGVHLFYMSGISLLFSMFGFRHIASSIGMTGIALTMFFMVEYSVIGTDPYLPVPAETINLVFVTSVVCSFLVIITTILASYHAISHAEAMLDREHQRSEKLLTNILPDRIAERLKNDPENVIADAFDSATVLVADIVAFTPLAAASKPEEVVRFLNIVFSEFDALAEEHGVEKLKTMGDAYMVIGGVPEPFDGHEGATARFALALLELTKRIGRTTGDEFSLRIGIHCGPLIAGVIGNSKYAYDCWGDTVNVATRVTPTAQPGQIVVTRTFADALNGSFQVEPLRDVVIKGIGPVETLALVREEEVAAVKNNPVRKTAASG